MQTREKEQNSPIQVTAWPLQVFATDAFVNKEMKMGKFCFEFSLWLSYQSREDLLDSDKVAQR